MKKALKNKVFLVAAAFFIIGTLTFVIIRNGNGKYAYAEVSLGEVSKTVSVTGKVRPIREATLGFERSGKIAGAFVRVGDTVAAGEPLVRLDSSEQYAALLQAEANLRAKQAALNKILRGAKPEEVKVSGVKVLNAGNAILNFKNAGADSLRDAYTKTDDAIRNKADQLFSSPMTSQPKFNHLVSDADLKRELEEKRFLLEKELNDFSDKLLGIGAGSDFSDLFDFAKQTLAKTAAFLNDLALALSALSPNAGLSQTTIDGWKSDIATARTTINTSISGLSSADKNLRDSEGNALLANEELALLKAPAGEEEIQNSEAAVAEAGAALLSAKVAFEKSTLRSPINALVVSQEPKTGEFVSAGEPVITLISDKEFEVETDVPEVDIGGIALGNPVTIVLDAMPNEEFSGEVFSIYPAETLIQGVPTYKVKISLDAPDESIRAGLTANLSILTFKKDGVLVLPARFVKEDQSGVYVSFVNKSGEFVRKPIAVGLHGTNGFIEIIGGLKKGDKVADLDKS